MRGEYRRKFALVHELGTNSFACGQIGLRHAGGIYVVDMCADNGRVAWM